MHPSFSSAPTRRNTFVSTKSFANAFIKTAAATLCAIAGLAATSSAQDAAPAPATSPAASPAAGQNTDFYQFVNATGGAFTDDQITVSFGKETSTLAQAKSHAAVPKNGRIYFTLTNAKGKWSDFVEYNWDAGKQMWYGNTTYVDAFVLPMTIELFFKDGSSKKMGISQSRAAIFEAFKKEAPPEFQACLEGDKRIVSPHMADMGNGKKYANYFDKYVDEIWASYATPKTFPSGNTVKVENGVLTVSKPGAKDIVVPTKPTTSDILLGVGGAKDAGLCAAFNRHIAGSDPADWRSPAAADTFYKAYPYNFYAKFMHEHTVDGKAYGFCYDDVSNQASYMQGPATKLVVTIYWDAAPATATATK